MAFDEEFKLNDDGTIPYIKKTSKGLTGTASQILDSVGSYIFVELFQNTLDDKNYPMVGKSIKVDIINREEWELDKYSYVSFESN